MELIEVIKESAFIQIMICLFVASFLLMLWLIATAPKGYQDEDGFHYGEEVHQVHQVCKESETDCMCEPGGYMCKGHQVKGYGGYNLDEEDFNRLPRRSAPRNDNRNLTITNK